MSKPRRISDLLEEEQGRTLFSFELFPPKTPKGWEKLFRTVGEELLPLEPAYVSVTYGAGGTTRERTHDLVTRIHREFGLTVVAHLTCVGSTRDEIDKALDLYDREGIWNILALRGDPPKDETLRKQLAPHLGEDGQGSIDFPYASDLVAHIRNRYPHFSIGVAGFPEGHPATPNRLAEMEYLKAKVDAGSNYVVTQLFFDNRDYFDYVERARMAGIQVPIIPGIMPVTSTNSLNKMAELAAGSRFPAALLRALDRAGDDDGVRQVGTHWATAQVADLLNHQVPGIHLYTLNNSRATVEICRNLGLHSYRMS